MNSIHLEKIDENNFLQAFGLKLGEGQDKFVSHPIRSLAQAYVYTPSVRRLAFSAARRWSAM